MAIDADYKTALEDLIKVQRQLQDDGIEAALEKSRRGGHLWILFETPVLAREARIQIIRYESVRDPEHASCVAALDPAVFGRGKPRALETWFIAASRERVRCAKEERTGQTWEFGREQSAGERD